MKIEDFLKRLTGTSFTVRIFLIDTFDTYL